MDYKDKYLQEKNYIERINGGKKDDSNEIVKFDKIVNFIRNSKK